MNVYEKPAIEISQVVQLLRTNHGYAAVNITPLDGGNLSKVFSFDAEGRAYVIHFSELHDAFETSAYISHLLASQGVPYPRTIAREQAGSLKYAISERIPGRIIADLPHEQKAGLLPDLVRLITRMNHVDVSSTTGCGWIQADGQGSHATWQEFLTAFYGEDQTGTFWEGWTDLFRTTCLERDVFEECYARLMEYSRYNAPHRHFVHSDCHAWNILSDGGRITGIIDPLGQYGDYVIDISIAEGVLPGQDVVRAIRAYQEELGIEMPHFEERMLGARYYKGLDGLRFYAKMGWDPNYRELRDFLLNLTH